MADSETGLDFSKTTEGDVETQDVIPLLTDEHMLRIPRDWIKSKGYIHPLTIGKGKKKISGFIPDYLIVQNAIPLAVIEVKSPNEQVETAYNEASAYALVLNRRFPSEVNPCKIVIGCNGDKISIGYWDERPRLTLQISDITVGSNALSEAQRLISKGVLESFSNTIATKLKLDNFKRPFNRKSGESILISKISQNSFANQINPILSRYFSSQPSGETSEIWKRGYISSNEITSYEKNLEAFLKDRIATAKRSDKILLKTSKKREPKLEGSIRDFINANNNERSGMIQIVTGSVGAGKSLFIRRFKEYLQPSEIKKVTHWAFIDFNNAPSDSNKFELWACEEFIKSIIVEGTELDLSAEADQERVFADKIHDRRDYYKRRNDIKAKEGELEKLRDIENWRVDPVISTKSISRYLQGDKGETIVIVFDNVDKKDGDAQLKIFQLAMWMKTETRAFIIIQMRDITFEQHKSAPPLDTFKTGAVFHIISPRFIDVVGKRLELSFEHLAEKAPSTLEFILKNGSTIKYPSSNAGKYLKTIYSQIFEEQKNISQLLEALSNRNVRSSLDMFMNILTSGHMTEGEIGEQVIFNKDFFVREHILVRTLMRTDYRFYHNKSGFISNLFYCNTDWERPSNFHLIEILFLLIQKRKVIVDNNLQGYLSFTTVSDDLARKGITKNDARKACLYALERGLIEADNLLISDIPNTTCFRATASAAIHMSFLSENIEYLSAILYTTPLNDKKFADIVHSEMRAEHLRRKQYLPKKDQLVKLFYNYLEKQVIDITKLYINVAHDEKTGAKYILSKVKKASQKYGKDKKPTHSK